MKYLSKENIKNKRVILRCDLNVPIKNNSILDDTKIIRSLKTINYLLKNNNKVIILSHFGRVKNEDDLKDNSLKIVYEEMKKYLPIVFIDNIFDFDKSILLKNNCVLFENTRYNDIPIKKESINDLELAKYYASFGDVFVFDAFGTSHRIHSSTAGIANFLPVYLGLLMEEEIEKLSILNNPDRPFTVIMGGAKVDDKIPVINSLISKCDSLILTGGILNSFLKEKGVEVGRSLISTDDNTSQDIKKFLISYSDKLYFSDKFIVEGTNNIKELNEINKEDVIIDNIFKTNKVIDNAKTIFMNGTCGKYEDDASSIGTRDLLNSLANVSAKVIIGGGDTTSAIKKFNNLDNFYYVSTGGGATLEFLAHNKINVVEYYKTIE